MLDGILFTGLYNRTQVPAANRDCLICPPTVNIQTNRPHVAAEKDGHATLTNCELNYKVNRLNQREELNSEQ